MKAERVEVKKVVDYEYQVTLSQRELEVILGTLAHIGGHDGEDGNRDVINTIFRGLFELLPEGKTYPRVIEPTFVRGTK